MPLSFFGAFSIIIFSILHPFHVSVTELNYKKKEKIIEITHKIFIDDLELGLKKAGFSEADLLKLNNDLKFKEYLTHYLGEHFQIKVHKKYVPVEYVGKEIEEDAIWCYFEVQGVKNFKEIEVINTVLMEVHSDQSNLIHFSKDDAIKSIRLSENRRSGKFNFK